MTPSASIAFGVWTPNKLVAAAKQYMAATSAPASAAIVRAGANQLTGFGADAPVPAPIVVPSAPTLSSNSANPAILALIGGAIVLIGLRVGASWYIGKKLGRPTSGAVVGGLFGAPGLGVLSLFPPGR